MTMTLIWHISKCSSTNRRSSAFHWLPYFIWLYMIGWDLCKTRSLEGAPPLASQQMWRVTLPAIFCVSLGQKKLKHAYYCSTLQHLCTSWEARSRSRSKINDLEAWSMIYWPVVAHCCRLQAQSRQIYSVKRCLKMSLFQRQQTTRPHPRLWRCWRHCSKQQGKKQLTCQQLKNCWDRTECEARSGK